MKSIKSIFSIKNGENKGEKILTIFGIKINYKTKEGRIIAQRNAILRGVQRSITTALLHQKTFSEFKNIYNGKTVVLIGAGPTVNYFEPINDAVYVGCNRAFLFDKVKFDYLFSIDKAGIDQYYEEFAAYKGNNCIKFIGDQNLSKEFQIPESYANNLKNARRYKTDAGYLSYKFALDIDSEPLGNFCTVSLQALQFILYTNPKKIYIVGIDCTVASQGHFQGKSYDNSLRNESSKENDQNAIIYYKQLKSFVEKYYPDTEIISINPVGLKGIFKDEYTQKYIDSSQNR